MLRRIRVNSKTITLDQVLVNVIFVDDVLLFSSCVVAIVLYSVVLLLSSVASGRCCDFVEQTLINISWMWKALCDIFHNVVSTI